jgi:hypothetical protein
MPVVGGFTQQYAARNVTKQIFSITNLSGEMSVDLKNLHWLLAHHS